MLYRKPGIKASDVVSLLLSVSFPQQLPGEEWVKLFRGADTVKINMYWAELMSFFYDLPWAIIQEFMSENGISQENLKEVYRRTPALPKRTFEEWLDYAYGR